MRARWIVVVAVIVGCGVWEACGQGTLMSQLGCANCHSDLPFKSNLKELAPDLSSAGLRYESAWLFEFLRKPSRVRRHLGPARMPNFHLSDKEAIALLAFLETQTVASNELPARIRTEIAGTTPVSAAQFQTTLTNGLICLSCHTLDGKGGSQGIELSSVGYRLRPDWVKEYLVAPSRFGVAHSLMPAQFFDITNQFRELTSNAAQKIRIIGSYLSSLNAPRKQSLQANYEAAKAAFPNASAELGRNIFISQNCAACHRHHNIQPREQAAPELAKEAARVTRSWLERFLKRPHAIRPFGYHPGDGSRMPNFGLSDHEVKELVGTLGAQAAPGGKPALSAFSKRKARLLLTEKLSCLGCHRLGETGGRIGPDLAAANRRLRPEYVENIIRNPRGTNPHTIMPQVPMNEPTTKLIANFLMQPNERADTDHYLSLTENTLSFATNNYLTHCAPCHGENGRGDGFNAAFLPKKPTALASAPDMSRRPDDTLYDAIHSGGSIVNKSHFMPPWGQSLSRKEIQDLVGNIRSLCQCEGPPWSRDNAK